MGDKEMKAKHLLKELYLSARGALIKLLVRSSSAAWSGPKSIRSILVIRIDRIGDVVVSLPAIKALKAIFPNADISVLVSPSNAAMLANVPYIAKVIPYVSFWRSMPRITDMKFDMAVDLIMDYSIKTAIIASVSGAKVRAGFDIASRGRFFNIAVTPSREEKRMSENILDIARSIAELYKVRGAADWDPEPHLAVSENAITAAEYIFKANNINRKDIIVSIHPGGYFPSQRWMPEAFAELADRLSDEYSARILLIGGPSDGELIKKIISMMKTAPVSVVGRPLDTVAAVIAASKLLIGNNSGLIHIAAALGTPTVSTMGPTVPSLWWPIGDSNTVIRHELACSPCGEASCVRHECMKRISVYEMEAAAVSRLGEARIKEENREKTKAKKIAAEKILVINLGGIGDVILSTPALRALRLAYPGSKIYFLSVKRVNELSRRMTYIDEALYLDLCLSMGSLTHNAKVVAYLNRLKVDLAVNMRTIVSNVGALKLRALLGLIAPGVTAGRDTEGMGSFFGVKIPESRIGEKSEMEYDLDLAMALGADVIDRKPDLPRDEASSVKIEEMLARYRGISQSDVLIGVHPGGKPSHRWPAEKFAEVIDAIAGRVKAKFIITGDDEDAETARYIISRSKADIIDSTGKLDLAELTALINHCSLYISSDTAAMHIAAILKVPLVAIFGPGYLKRFDPRNISKDAIVIKRDTACSPCDRSICPRPVCLSGIPAGEVTASACKLLGIGEKYRS